MLISVKLHKITTCAHAHTHTHTHTHIFFLPCYSHPFFVFLSSPSFLLFLLFYASPYRCSNSSSLFFSLYAFSPYSAFCTTDAGPPAENVKEETFQNLYDRLLAKAGTAKCVITALPQSVIQTAMTRECNEHSITFGNEYTFCDQIIKFPN